MADTKISAATIIATPAIASTPVAKNGSTVAYRRVDNLAASTSPGVSDDNTAGYHPGSLWFRIDTGQFYKCRSASTGAAVWIRLADPIIPDHVAGRYYLPFGYGSATSPSAHAANTIRLFPFTVPNRCTVSEIVYRLGTVLAATNGSAAIYANDPATNKPTGNALSSVSANLNTATGGNTTRSQALTANVQLEPGLIYWLASNCDSATPVFVTIASNSALVAFASLVGSAAITNLYGGSGAEINHLSVAQTFGTWPDLTSGSFTEVTSQNMPLLGFKVQSVP